MKNKTIIYLFVFDWPKEGKLTVPGVKNRVVSAKLLDTGARLKSSETTEGVEIAVPAKAPDPVASVIELKISGMMDN